MTKNMRKAVTIFCLLTMMIVPCQAVFASEANTEYAVSPRMIYISDYSVTFGIPNCVADVDVEVNGDVLKATKSKVIAELQVKNGSSWIPVAIWTAEDDDYDARVHETHDVVKGHTYRVKGTFMVWEGSAYETEYDYSDEITA
ncbi:MAG: hypothetical protein J6C83_05255 [Peptococcaceae bacterium]|nr:hypothetical protein [Peptococcaceae bacterium]MBO5140735.1 hypothetical protein [Peptococcaceae bacterium]MBO5300960.1 hypothetical protein [Peptococcaceae bacterium]